METTSSFGSGLTGKPVFDAGYFEDLDLAIRNIPAAMLGAGDAEQPGLDPAVSADPYSHFRALQAAHGDVVPFKDGHYGPLAVYNAFGHDLTRPNFAVMGYKTIEAMATDPEHFVNARAYGGHGAAGGRAMVNETDGDEHRQLRRVFNFQIFGMRRLVDFADACIDPLAEHLARRAAVKLDLGEAVDLSRDLAMPLVYASMAQIIGVPVGHLSHYVKMAERALGGNRDFEGAMAAVAELTAFFDAEYQRRLRSGSMGEHDLMALMAGVEDKGFRFSGEDIVAYCRFLLPVGIETTWRQLANTCYALMGHGDQFAELVANEGLRPAAIEEALRWLPSGSILPRRCAKDTKLAEVEVPAGSSLCGFFGVANRDPSIWENPDAFDIHRKRIPHLTFSTGLHHCMGQNLARQVLKKAVDALCTHLSNARLDRPWQEVPTEGFVIRCASEVPIRLQ
jgi:cytochrome P450